MSVLDRMRKAVAGTIAEIEAARRAATAELISYKAGEKLMAARAEELAVEVDRWQRRAEQAVLAGDDALAQEALDRKAEVIAELARVRADREEQATIAADMLRGRRELDAALQRLKLREGSVAAGLAAARTGETPFATEGGAFDRFDDAERKIEEEAILAELSEGEIDASDMARQKLSDQVKSIRAEDALEELKKKLEK